MFEIFRPYLDQFEKQNTNISNWSVGKQIEHCILAAEKITGALESSKPEDYKRTFKPLKLIVFTSGTIPRGKGKAPEIVIPENEITKEKLEAGLKKGKQLEERLSNLDSNTWFEHHVFGNLKKKDAIKFINIHNKHHLKIIVDICR